jgi:hypothetical protein
VTKVTRGFNAAGTDTIVLHLSSAAKKRLKHKRKLKMTITVRYASVTGSSSSGHVDFTVKKA